MEIRLAQPGDLTGWLQLVEPMRRLFPGLETPESMEGYARDIAGAISRQEALCAEENGTVCGVLAFSRAENELAFLAVSGQHRRRGIGLDLLNVFENFARGNQLAFLTLEVRSSNAAAIALYQKAGYEEAGRRRGYYARPREDAVIMTLWLKSGSGPAEEEKGEGSHADTGI